ncbi:MAG: ComC/BlpC family leader-containing pheromone/bacteriocin [Spirosomataceae bacterium]
MYANDSRQLSKLRRKFNRLSNKYLERIEGGSWWMRAFGEAPVYFLK